MDLNGRMAGAVLVLALALGLVACVDGTASPSVVEGAGASDPPLPAATELSAIACATADPVDVGDLTGTWRGAGSSVYYLRQVGECVWWFGTDLTDIEPGRTGQFGFANVGSGRLVGDQLHMEYADLPIGDILGGGGLTFVYEADDDRLRLVQQRGGWQQFGDAVLTRIDPDAGPRASPRASTST